MNDALKVLWYLEPATFRFDPLEISPWLGWVVQQIRASKQSSEGLEHGVATSAPGVNYLRDHLREYDIYYRALSQCEVQGDFSFDRYAYVKDLLANPETPVANNTLLEALRTADTTFEPDVVISFGENRYLADAFSKAGHLYTEFAPYSRMACQPALFLDPCGHQGSSILVTHCDSILSAPLDHVQASALEHLWRDAVETPTRMHVRFEPLGRWLADRAQGRPVALLATQPPDWPTYEGAYAALPLDALVMRWLSKLPEEWAGCVTFHPKYRLGEACAAAIEAEFPNAIIAPAHFTGPVSELLLPRVDAVAAVSSSIGVQAALWGKPLCAYGRSSLAGLGPWRLEEVGEARGLSGEERLSLWRFLTHRYCHRLEDLIFSGEYLFNLLREWRESAFGPGFILDTDAWQENRARHLAIKENLPGRRPRRVQPEGPKLVLFNDYTVVHHPGSLALSDGHHRIIKRAGATLVRAVDAFEIRRVFQPLLAQLPFKDEVSWLEEAAAIIGANDFINRLFQHTDAVAVNGEGTIHHSAGMPYLALLLAAKQAGLKTALVNTVLYALPNAAAHALATLDTLAVREPVSAREAERLGVRAEVEPDAILEALFIEEPEIDYTGKVVITDAHWEGAYEEVMDLCERAPWPWAYWKLDCFHDWRKTIASLRTARLLVTARHHGVYFAMLAGIPFVALPANTPKIEGILEMLQHPLPLCQSVEQAMLQVDELLEDPEKCTRSYHRILNQRPLMALHAFIRSLKNIANFK